MQRAVRDPRPAFGRGDALFEIDSDNNETLLPRTNLKVSNFVAVQPAVSSNNEGGGDKASTLFRGNSDTTLANGIIIPPGQRVHPHERLRAPRRRRLPRARGDDLQRRRCRPVPRHRQLHSGEPSRRRSARARTTTPTISSPRSPASSSTARPRMAGLRSTRARSMRSSSRRARTTSARRGPATPAGSPPGPATARRRIFGGGSASHLAADDLIGCLL